MINKQTAMDYKLFTYYVTIWFRGGLYKHKHFLNENIIIYDYLYIYTVTVYVNTKIDDNKINLLKIYDA